MTTAAPFEMVAPSSGLEGMLAIGPQGDWTAPETVRDLISELA